MKKKYLIVILCLLVACGLIMYGILLVNKEGYTLNNDNDFIDVMTQIDSSFQEVKHLDQYNYKDEQNILKVFAMVDQDGNDHLLVFQQKNNGKYDLIYHYSRIFEIAYCLKVRHTDLVIIGMPNYDGLGKRLEVVTDNGDSFHEDIDQWGYILKVYNNKNIITALLYDSEMSSIDYEMIFADIGEVKDGKDY